MNPKQIKTLDNQINSLINNHQHYSYSEIHSTSNTNLLISKPTICLNHISIISTKYINLLFTTIIANDNNIMEVMSILVSHKTRLSILFNKIFYSVLNTVKLKLERKGIIFDCCILEIPMLDFIDNFYVSKKNELIFDVLKKMFLRDNESMDIIVSNFMAHIKSLHFFNSVNDKLMESLYESFKESLDTFKDNVVDNVYNIKGFLKREMGYKCVLFFKDKLMKRILNDILNFEKFWDINIFFKRDELEVIMGFCEIIDSYDSVNRNLDNFFDYFQSLCDYSNIVYMLTFLLQSADYLDNVFEKVESVKVYFDNKILYTIQKFETLLIQELNKTIHKYIVYNKTELKLRYGRISDTSCQFDMITAGFKAMNRNQDPIIQFDIHLTEKLFNKISCKYDFAMDYNKYLIKRLYSHKSDILYEENIINRLKKKSKNVLFYKSNLIIKEYNSYECFMDSKVYLIQRFYWKDTEIYKLPVDENLLAIEKAYMLKYDGCNKDLVWRHDLTACEVEINDIFVVISLVQYEILKILLIENISMNDLNIRFENFEYLKDHLRVLENNDIITYTDKMYSINNVEKIRETNLVPNIPFKDNIIKIIKTENKVYSKDESIYTVDSKIMSELKKNKKIKKTGFIKYIIEMMNLDEKMIVERLEGLFEKGYLDNDGDYITYIP